MGIFNRASPADRAAKQQSKLTEKLVKKGIDIDGLITGAESFDEQTIFTLLYEDRVDVVTLPKFGSLLMSGQGLESYPLVNITAVGMRSKGIWSYLKVQGSGFEREVRGNASDIPDLTRAIKEQKKFLASNS